MRNSALALVLLCTWAITAGAAGRAPLPMRAPPVVDDTPASPVAPPCGKAGCTCGCADGLACTCAADKGPVEAWYSVDGTLVQATGWEEARRKAAGRTPAVTHTTLPQGQPQAYAAPQAYGYAQPMQSFAAPAAYGFGGGSYGAACANGACRSGG